MNRKALILAVPVLMIFFFAGLSLWTILGGKMMTVQTEALDRSTLACEDGASSEHGRQFERETELHLAVSTSACPIQVELLDFRSRLLKMRGEPYAPLTSFAVPAGGSESVFIAELTGSYFVEVKSASSIPLVTDVSVNWIYASTQPDPLPVYVASGSLLAGGVSILVGLLLLVRETRLPQLGALLAGLSGLAFAVSPYAYPSLAVSLGSLNFPVFIGTSSLLVGLSFYFLAQRLLGTRTLGLKVTVSLGAYLVAGTLAIILSAMSVGFSGYPFVLVLFWPIGVVFILFSESVYNPVPLIAFVWSAAAAVVVIGVGTALLSYRQHRANREPERGRFVK